jgi:hypothetical protein
LPVGIGVGAFGASSGYTIVLVSIFEPVGDGLGRAPPLGLTVGAALPTLPGLLVGFGLPAALGEAGAAGLALAPGRTADVCLCTALAGGPPAAAPAAEVPELSPGAALGGAVPSATAIEKPWSGGKGTSVVVGVI